MRDAETRHHEAVAEPQEGPDVSEENWSKMSRYLPIGGRTLFNTVNRVSESSPGQRGSIGLILGPWDVRV